MKFQVIMILLLIRLLGGLAVVLNAIDTQVRPPPAAPTQSTQPDQFKNFRIP